MELAENSHDYTSTKDCITVSSDTQMQIIVLVALGIECGDEIITTSFTFAAAGKRIVLLGETPVFVFLNTDRCKIDSNKIEIKIASVNKANTNLANHYLPVTEDAA